MNYTFLSDFCTIYRIPKIQEKLNTLIPEFWPKNTIYLNYNGPGYRIPKTLGRAWPLDEPESFIEHSLTEDKACQVPGNAHTCQGYECVGPRRKTDIRSEIMCKIDALLENYTFFGEEGRQAIINDILSSQKFQGRLGDVFTKYRKQSSDDKILKQATWLSVE